MKVPLNREIADLYHSMPKAPGGYVINPAYVPHGTWGKAYIKALGDWCREHPTEWQKIDWLKDYVMERKRGHERSGPGQTQEDTRTLLAGNSRDPESKRND